MSDKKDLDIDYGKMCSNEQLIQDELLDVTEDDMKKWTSHTGTYYVVNKIGGHSREIINLKVIHTASNVGEEVATFTNIPTGGRTSGTKFTYTTGPASPFDYWYVEGMASYGPGVGYFRSKKNFYCSVAAKDDGNVELIIHGDGRASTLEVKFNKSSGCKTIL